MEMDRQLEQAARHGDVEFLKKAVAVQPPEYFFALSSDFGCSVFHFSIWTEKVKFMKEAMHILPTNILKKLLLITDVHSCTPLHFLVSRNSFSVTKCVVDMYASLSWDDEDHVKPWLALTKGNNNTPLNLALKHDLLGEHSVMEIMSLDPELECCTIADSDGNTPLYYALKKGFNLAAEKMLKSPLVATYILGSPDLFFLVRLATNCTGPPFVLKCPRLRMDLQLKEAARLGDEKFLKEALATQRPPEYFLAQDDHGSSIFHIAEALAVERPENFLAQDGNGSSIFHIAVQENKVEFMKEAMNILPPRILKQLLLITDSRLYTPLHFTVLFRNKSGIKCIREMYASLSWDDEDHVKPWLALTWDNQTPLNLALGKHEMDEECAMEIMLMDPELDSCTVANKDGNTPLYYAVKRSWSCVAEKILKSRQPATSILGSTDLLSLVSLATNCTGNVVKLLFEKCDGFIDNDGNTPLHSAMNLTSTQELALETLSTYPALRHICNNRGESPFFLAVKAGYKQVVDAIMGFEEPRYHMLCRNDGTTVLHTLSSCPEKTGQMLLEKYWWLNNLRDYQGKTALDYAKQEKTHWLVNLLTNPSLIKKQDFDWVEACKREEIDAVLAFVDNCEDLQRACRKENDTPLHHVKLATYKDYLNFLKIRSVAELKNTTDHDGATPLHRALERKDIYFAKALLLDDEVQQTITDYNGRTAMHLLAKLCKENDEWDKMCKLIKVNPDLKTSYIQAGTNLDQIRNTLSVIAALLATITFAAGFTLPGGINSDNGEALLAKKAAFLVFLLTDAYGMCTSMLVLFCLVWSMVSEPSMARLLVDRSVLILMQSLYATLLAFMTGIYAVIEHSSLWAAIVIFVMCSIVGISANRTILHKAIAKLVPAANNEKQDRLRLLEEGNAASSTGGKDSSGKTEYETLNQDESKAQGS